MRRTFQTTAPNGPFGDPLVVVRPRLLSRTLLLDAGDAATLSPRTLLNVTDLLISHAHVDHVFGLARALRVRFGRTDRPLRVFGPPGLLARVRSLLDSYTWNLTPAFPLDLTITEVHADRTEAWRFPTDAGFAPTLIGEGPGPAVAPVLADELLDISALLLDHAGLPSLAWRLREHRALNIDAQRLARHGLPKGPWLARLKDLIRRGADQRSSFPLPNGEWAPIGQLRAEFVRETAGDSLVYATDANPTEGTAQALIAFTRGMRRLVIETHFLEADLTLAEQHGHLTAARAGDIGKRAGVLAVSPTHLSTRYEGRMHEVLAELAEAARPTPIEELPTGPLVDAVA